MRRRGRFPAQGHTTWGVPAEGCSLGGPGPNAGGTFQKQNQASYACRGPAEGQPCAGDTGKVTPHPVPPTASQAQGGCRLPFPAQRPSRKRLQACPPRRPGAGAALKALWSQSPGWWKNSRKGPERGWEPARGPGAVPPRAGGAGAGHGPHHRAEPSPGPHGVTGPSPARASCALRWRSAPWCRWPSGGSTAPAR